MSLHSTGCRGLEGSGRGTRVRRKGFSFWIWSLHSSNKFCHVSFKTDLELRNLRLNQSRIVFWRLTLTFCHKQSQNFFPSPPNRIITNVNHMIGNTCCLLRADSQSFVPTEFSSLLEQTKNLRRKKYLIIVCYERVKMQEGCYGGI